MKLHPKYIEMLESVLTKTDFDSVIAAYDKPAVRGLRFNSKKPSVPPFSGNFSEMNPDVFIPENYSETVTHPLHHAGSYYIQDPSATIPVLALDLQEEDCVIDLCAAPGGKSTYILDKIGSGFLLSNEIDTKRNQKLVHNLQRWGHENVTVVQESLDTIAKHHANTFDKVLLDAPCSGEGLYRRRPDFALEYKPETAIQFATLQLELLESAYELVKDGGTLVYATCTLNEIENEGVISKFLESHPDVTLSNFTMPHATPSRLGMGIRILPSDFGEGQYLVKLSVNKDEPTKLLVFKEKMNTHAGITANFSEKNNTTHILKSRGFLKTKLKITMDGTPFGVIKGKTWDFDHALAQSVAFQSAFDSIDLDLETSYRYLYGHALSTKVKGIHCVKYQNNSLGFVKGTGTHANNRYPKGLRNKFDSYIR